MIHGIILSGFISQAVKCLHCYQHSSICPPLSANVCFPDAWVQEHRSEEQCVYTESASNQAVLTDLRRATQYEVQVRAHTEAGYGSFSAPALFRTLPDGKEERVVAAARTHTPHTHSPTHALSLTQV